MRRQPSGFTLLEVLVATALMAIAIAGLLSNLTTSMTNAARLTDYDRASLLARRKMDALLAERFLPIGVPLEGRFDESSDTSWRARVTPFEWGPAMPMPGKPILERIELEVIWKNGVKQRIFRLETCRMATLREVDMPALGSSAAAGVTP